MSVLAVDGLRVSLPTGAGLVPVVNGVDYRVEQGEVFGVAGESGSGKTISMLALLGLLPAGSAVEGRYLPWKALLWMPLVCATMHVSWGLGFLLGLREQPKAV